MKGVFSKNLPLTVTPGGTGTQWEVTGSLYGGIENSGLLVGGFGDHSFARGEEILVKVEMDGTVVGFWATVLEQLGGAGGAYLLSLPDKMDTLSRRNSERLPVVIPAEVSLLDAQGMVRERAEITVMTNLSLGGCRIATQPGLAENTSCRIAFSLPGEQEGYVFEGRILRRDECEGRLSMGVRFAGGASPQVDGSSFGQWLERSLKLVGGVA